MSEQERPRELLPYCIKEKSRLHNRYIIEELLGEGGFGITYRGFDELLMMPVAIKEFYPDGMVHRDTVSQNDNTVYTYHHMDEALYEKGRKAFLNEARTMAYCGRMEGIVLVRDFFEENNTAYIVMDYLDGVSVKQYVRRQGPMQATEVLEKIQPIIRALQVIHEQGIIHRDISADNIMVLEDGSLQLIDFGSARKIALEDSSMHSMTIMFKRGFAAEEQYRLKGKQGPWTDVYGICTSIYYMMTGIVPDESVERAIHDTVRPLSEIFGEGVGEISRVIAKGMQIMAKDRIQSMADLYQGLYQEALPKIKKVPLIDTKDNGENVPRRILKKQAITLTTLGNELQVEIQKEWKRKSGRRQKVFLRSVAVWIFLLGVGVGTFFAFIRPMESSDSKMGQNDVTNQAGLNGKSDTTKVVGVTPETTTSPDPALDSDAKKIAENKGTASNQIKPEPTARPKKKTKSRKKKKNKATPKPTPVVTPKPAPKKSTKSKSQDKNFDGTLEELFD